MVLDLADLFAETQLVKFVLTTLVTQQELQFWNKAQISIIVYIKLTVGSFMVWLYELRKQNKVPGLSDNSALLS